MSCTSPSPLERALRVGALLSFCALAVACADESGDASPVDAAYDAMQVAPEAALPDVQDAGVQDAGMIPMPALDAAAQPQPMDSSVAGLRPRRALIAPALWVEQSQADDPFGDRPASATCAPTGHMAELLNEEGAYSVDTGLCNYITVKQVTRTDIAAGEVVKMRLWHFELKAPEPAEAHAAVLLDGMPLFEERIAIPHTAQLVTRTLPMARAVPAGTPIHFHLHNHGDNSWSLVELSTGP